jgi:hypothetical protein
VRGGMLNCVLGKGNGVIADCVCVARLGRRGRAVVHTAMNLVR